MMIRSKDLHDASKNACALSTEDEFLLEVGGPHAVLFHIDITGSKATRLSIMNVFRWHGFFSSLGIHLRVVMINPL